LSNQCQHLRVWDVRCFHFERTLDLESATALSKFGGRNRRRRKRRSLLKAKAKVLVQRVQEHAPDARRRSTGLSSILTIVEAGYGPRGWRTVGFSLVAVAHSNQAAALADSADRQALAHRGSYSSLRTGPACHT
jgi:hypothetical protein